MNKQLANCQIVTILHDRDKYLFIYLLTCLFIYLFILYLKDDTKQMQYCENKQLTSTLYSNTKKL